MMIVGLVGFKMGVYGIGLSEFFFLFCISGFIFLDSRVKYLFVGFAMCILSVLIIASFPILPRLT
jgi:hypothetical protein